jgi:uncharacterized protein (DUF362 family)
MKHYVKINTLFNKPDDRTIDFLANKYNDLDLLKQSISDLLADELINTNKIRGKKVFIKPNWVLHNLKPEDELCMRTHNNFVLAALEIILEAGPVRVCIADAPIQGCDWNRIMPESFSNQIVLLGLKYGIPVLIKDLRRTTFNPEENNPKSDLNPISDYIIFNLGENSYLEPISLKDKNLFRVTNYNPDRLAESHKKGIHKYCITKELFTADIIISLPKIKTHQKTGITAALKNVVGINGDKDFLPHHRIGGTGFGGDCYPGKNYFRYFAELSLDQANRNQGKSSYWMWSKLSAGLWFLSIPGRKHYIAASWHGNDTTWRMVLDLNKIILFGTKDGSLSDTPQRKMYSLGDGIIGGQGDGPLHPYPLPLGVITFSDDSRLHDLAIGVLMRFDINKLPLLTPENATESDESRIVTCNGVKIELKDLEQQFGIDTIPPPGWLNYINKFTV